jgi:Nif-specific regulatory protein
MDPRLIAISGSLKGTIFALTENEVSVGREASNSLCLSEPSISRRHCLLKAAAAKPESQSGQEAEFQLIDLESFNGTFVNGIPVKEHTLAHGDQIALGDVQFLFLTHEVEAGSAVASQMDEGDLITRSTVRLRQEDAFYLRPEKLLAELPDSRDYAQVTDAAARVARDLNTLLKISTTINSIRNVGELQRRLLELILEIIPAEREAILLVDEGQVVNEGGPVDEGPRPFASVCCWSSLIGPGDSIKVSQTITNQVLREGVALLSNDLFESEGLGERPSLVAARVCSVLCVPLVVFDKPLGVIYLDTSDPLSRFDEGHLQLLSAIAGIAAVAFDNAERFQGLQHENQRLQEEVHLKHTMIGESVPMREIYRFLAKVAATQSTVLLLGESGTGKELAAHAIHLNSSRAAKPFVAINCATLTETLLESELFGHEKGAFTGAIAQRRGKLEVADGGTVFLDEVGELTPMIQAKLLRVLQEREFERVGSTRPIKVDVRIVAATNKDLEAAIKEGGFRRDLYYRLNVVSIAMPPLRERREDISLLASYFVAKYSKHCKRRVSGISAEARNALRSYDWPGNVRELENAIERAVVLGSSDSIRLDDLPESLLESGQAVSLKSGYYEALRETKKQLITKMLEQTGGNYTEAAMLLGVHPNNLHRLIRSLNLKTSLKKT